MGSDKQTVSSWIAEFLHAQGVTHLFELTGGHIAALLDAVALLGKTRIISVHQEQGAGFAAEAQARLSGRPGVVATTSGPGALNVLTAVANAYFDSTPLVVISGQVHTRELHPSRPVRQSGFQQTNIVDVARPITKAVFQVVSSEQVPSVFESAFRTAMEGRPGPVLIDLPMDLQRLPLAAAAPRRVELVRPTADVAAAVQEMLGALTRAKRPVILAGGGLRSAQAVELLRAVLKRWRIPVATSMMGLDAVAHDDPLRAGFIGTWGNRWTNLALGESDLMLVLGSRLDTRQTGHEVERFKGDRVVIQVDCDPAEVNHRIRGVTAVIADLHVFLSSWLEAAPASPSLSWDDWLARIEELRRQYPDTQELRGLKGYNPNVVVRQLGLASDRASAITLDVGQHQLWACQSHVFHSRQRVLISGGLGAMGFALPAAIGAALACPGSPVVTITGDGAFQINIQELQTLVRNRLPIKIVVLNNHAHGMVRMLQSVMLQGRYQSCAEGYGYSAPDFCRVAEAYGVVARRIGGSGGEASESALQAGLEWLWADPLAPALLEVEIPFEANVRPETSPGGRVVFDMIPPE